MAYLNRPRESLALLEQALHLLRLRVEVYVVKAGPRGQSGHGAHLAGRTQVLLRVCLCGHTTTALPPRELTTQSNAL